MESPEGTCDKRKSYGMEMGSRPIDRQTPVKTEPPVILRTRAVKLDEIGLLGDSPVIPLCVGLIVMF